MIINISNVARTSQVSPADMEKTAADCEFIPKRSAHYFQECMRYALLTAVVTCDRTIRGVCVCKTSLIPDACEIETISVSDNYRRIGLGKKLLSHCLRNMRTLKIKSAFVWIDERNTQTVNFFTKFGFRPDGKSRVSQSDRKAEEFRYRIDI